MRLLDLLDALEQGRLVAEPCTFANTLYGENPSPEKVWDGIRRHPLHQSSLKVLQEKAAKLRTEKIASLPFSLYRLLDETGNRRMYEAAYFAHRGRLNTFALLTLMGDESALADLEDAIWAICDEYTWCLPAHLNGRSMEGEFVSGTGALSLQQGWPHSQQVDLFASETAFALAEICALVEERLAPVVKARAEAQIWERVLGPVCAPGPAWIWETLTNNWAAVCAGSIGVAAMYLVEDNRILAPILQRMLSAMDTFMSGFEADGACVEGLGYWNYGFGFYTCFAERLLVRTGGRMDLMANEKVREIALFQQRAWLSGNSVVSFSDGTRTETWHPGLTHYLHRRIPEIAIPDAKYIHRFGDDRCHRWCMDLRNFLWSDPIQSTFSGMNREPSSTGSVWFQDAAWMISRTRHRGIEMAFAAKGGHNDEAHNHNDLGSFLIHAGGETFVTDPGKGEYTKGYFGLERYAHLVVGSRGHSVPLICGHEQTSGLEHHADVIQADISPERDILALDLTAAYGLDALSSFTRTFLWDKSKGGTLLLEDHLVLAEAGGVVKERFVTFLEPKIQGEDILLQGEQGTLRISPGITGFHVDIGSEAFSGHNAELETLWWVDFVHTAAESEVFFRAVFRYDPEMQQGTD